MKHEILSEQLGLQRAETVAYAILSIASAATILYSMLSVLDSAARWDQIVAAWSVKTVTAAQHARTSTFVVAATADGSTNAAATARCVSRAWCPARLADFWRQKPSS